MPGYSTEPVSRHNGIDLDAPFAFVALDCRAKQTLDAGAIIEVRAQRGILNDAIDEGADQ